MDVDADVEASIRNYAQVSRTLLYALLFTVILTTVNSGVLSHRLDLQATWSAFALAMSQVGAFFALRRSNETRAYLGDVRLALHELTARTVLTSIEAFTQPILEKPTDGAGIIANLAIAADQASSYYQATAAKPPTKWFKPDPVGGRAETVAAFLLPDETGSPIGAFALTSPRVNALNVDDDGLPERLGLIIEQCTVTVVGIARVAHALWNGEDEHAEDQ